MARALTAYMFSGLAFAMLDTTALAQNHRVGDWQGGKVDDGFGGCAYAKKLAEDVDILLYASPTTIPRLEVQKADWGLFPTHSMQLKLSFGEKQEQYIAEQARTLEIVRIEPRDRDGNNDILAAMMSAQELSFEIDGEVFSTPLSRIDAVVASLDSCVGDGEPTLDAGSQAGGAAASSSAQSSVTTGFDLGNALSQLPTGRIAGFTCLITTGQMYGILTAPADDPGDTYPIEVFEDGSMSFQGGRVDAGHLEYASHDPDQLEGAAYDVRSLTGAGASYELPPTYGKSGEQFSDFMQEYTKVIGEALLGNRQRWLVINIPQDIVAFSDIDADGNLVNTVAPECYRTQ